MAKRIGKAKSIEADLAAVGLRIPSMTPAMECAAVWLQQHGGDGVYVRTVSMGGYWLASGCQMPFWPATIRRLINCGIFEVHAGKRIRLSPTGRKYVDLPDVKARAAAFDGRVD